MTDDVLWCRWLIGENCRALTNNAEEIRDWTDPEVIAELNKSNIVMPLGNDTVLDHDYGRDELGIWGLKKGAIPGRGQYVDGKQIGEQHILESV